VSRGQLPKAYLRIDPNLDQHPDAPGMLKMICAANRQHPRGYFQRVTALSILGRKRLAEFTTPRPGKKRPDLVELPDGRLYLEGWEHWQEGDWTVGERVQRLREKRSGGVTEPLPEPVTEPLPPSEALGVKASGTDQRPGSKARAQEPDPKAANPLVDRDTLVAEGYRLIGVIKALEGLDPTEILHKASDWKGFSYVALDAIPDNRLAQTLAKLRSWARKLKGEPEPGPPARVVPMNERAKERLDGMNAMIRGGLREGRNLDSGDEGPAHPAGPGPAAGGPRDPGRRLPPGAGEPTG